MNFMYMMYVLFGACLVGGFVEDAGRRTREHLARIEAKLDALAARGTTPKGE